MKLQGLITLVYNQLLRIVSTFNFLDHLLSNETEKAVLQTSKHRAAHCLRGTSCTPQNTCATNVLLWASSYTTVPASSKEHDKTI